MNPFDFFTADQKRRPLDITGVENAILDFLVRGEDSDLQELGLDKGIMKLVETEEQAAILEHVGGLEPEIEAGGSCANVLRVAARFGSRTSYSSAVGPDLNGALFEKELQKAEVVTRLAHVEGATGTSVILVTPDGERTMNTHLGDGPRGPLFVVEERPLAGRVELVQAKAGDVVREDLLPEGVARPEEEDTVPRRTGRRGPKRRQRDAADNTGRTGGDGFARRTATGKAEGGSDETQAERQVHGWAPDGAKAPAGGGYRPSRRTT